QMGDFKGAADPLTRSEMRPEFREQFTKVIDDYYEKSVVGRIAEGRKNLTAEQVKKLIDDGPYTARRAKDVGLIDQLCSFRQVQELVKKEQKSAQVKLHRDYGKAKLDDLDFSNPFALLKLFAPVKLTSSSKPKVAVIYAVGPITTGKGGESLFGEQVVGSD